MSKISVWTGALAAAATAGCYHTAVTTVATPSPDKTAASAASQAPQYFIDGISTTAAGPTPAASSTPLYVIDGTVVTAAPPSIGGAITPAPSDATPLYVIDGVIVDPVAPVAPHP